MVRPGAVPGGAVEVVAVCAAVRRAHVVAAAGLPVHGVQRMEGDKHLATTQRDIHHLKRAPEARSGGGGAAPRRREGRLTRAKFYVFLSASHHDILLDMSTSRPDRSHHRSLVLALSLPLGACSGFPGAAGAGPAECTDIACNDGFTVAFSPNSGWQAGSYRFTIDVDGAVTTCEGALPLRACNAGASLACSPASQRVGIGESGCALPVEQHAFSELAVTGQPAQRISVTIAKDGAPLVQKTFTPAYVTSQPNGEGCGPVCKSASDTLTVPGVGR
jgi:hypothetical protein